MGQLFRYCTAALSGLLPFRWLQTFNNHKIIFPFYHLVANERVGHVAHLYSYKNENEFVKDLDFLLKRYKPLSILELYEGKIPDRDSFLLTFDDGLIEFKEIVAPILLRKGVPAINFLNSGFVDNTDLFYRYKASLLIEETRRDKASCRRLRELFPESGYGKGVKEKLLKITYHERESLDIAAHHIGFSYHDYLAKVKPYMTSEDVRALAKAGFDFGGHSIDHPEYWNLNLENQVKQTLESVAAARQLTGARLRLFSFPFSDTGVKESFFDNEWIKNNVDFMFGTAGIKKEKHRGHFQRIPMEERKGKKTAEQLLRREYIYFFFKMLLGRNVNHRV